MSTIFSQSNLIQLSPAFVYKLCIIFLLWLYSNVGCKSISCYGCINKIPTVALLSTRVYYNIFRTNSVQIIFKSSKFIKEKEVNLSLNLSQCNLKIIIVAQFIFLTNQHTYTRIVFIIQL